jgi:hypothetical protein
MFQNESSGGPLIRSARKDSHESPLIARFFA